MQQRPSIKSGKSKALSDNLTEEQRRMYAVEKLDNFRWISKLVATHSEFTLTDIDLVPDELHKELAELGQFAELAYSPLPVAFLIEHHALLMQPRYPLENYDVLLDCVLVDSVRGNIADVPAFIVFRPTKRQLVVSICGTSSMKQAFQDIRAMRTAHPSGRGNVHSGFWYLYQGIKDKLFAGIRKGFEDHSPNGLALTGHSMGGSLSYLLCMDLLADKDVWWPNVMLTLAVFGVPRSGDADLVRHFHSLVDGFKQRWGAEAFQEYSVKGYNDGVPALPPAFLGYRHFCKQPFYTVCGQLYRTPASECENALFHVDSKDGTIDRSIFPKGGHNYYNGRDFERFVRRVLWLNEANVLEDGWQDRYIAITTE